MVDSVRNLSFGKVNMQIYSVSDVLLYLEYDYTFELLFNVSRHTRLFVIHNYQKIKRSFVNEGLKHNFVDVYFETSFF
jgi:hypothetical protein